jgi:hypothetical protein
MVTEYGYLCMLRCYVDGHERFHFGQTYLLTYFLLHLPRNSQFFFDQIQEFGISISKAWLKYDTFAAPDIQVHVFFPCSESELVFFLTCCWSEVGNKVSFPCMLVFYLLLLCSSYSTYIGECHLEETNKHAIML